MQIDRSAVTLKLNQLFDHQMTHFLLEEILVNCDGLMITKYEKTVYYNWVDARSKSGSKH